MEARRKDISSSLSLNDIGLGTTRANKAQDAFPGVVEFGDDDPSVEEKKVKKKKKSGGFQSMGLSRPVFRGVMKKGYRIPTPIQRKAIPPLLAGEDVVAMARTGSGKTAAFLIPMYEKLKSHSQTAGIRSVILSPTRELALQTYSVTKELGRFTDLRYCLLVGGSAMEGQFEQLSKSPDIIVATPGRLMHHLVEVKFSLTSVQYCVFDEADRLFEMGFAAQLHEILRRMSEERQTALFSATMPSMLMEFTRAGLRNPSVIRLDAETKISENLGIQFLSLRQDQKPAALLYLLQSIIPESQQTLVFAATRHHVEFLTKILTYAHVPVTCVYGVLDSAARKINIAKFRAKKAQVMVVTDVAARGIDIPLLDNVINYNFPAKPKLFVHRVGRVARAGRSGVSYSLVCADELPYMLDLYDFLNRPVETELKPGTEYNPTGGISYCGVFPHQSLDSNAEYVTQIIKLHQLEQAQKVTGRANKMYNRTRSGATGSNARKAKRLNLIQIHPLFAHHNVSESKEQRSLSDFLTRVSSFKARCTIFESMEHNNAVMRQKRATHEGYIEKTEQKRKHEQQLKEAERRSVDDESTISNENVDSASSSEEEKDNNNNNKETISKGKSRTKKESKNKKKSSSSSSSSSSSLLSEPPLSSSLVDLLCQQKANTKAKTVASSKSRVPKHLRKKLKKQQKDKLSGGGNMDKNLAGVEIETEIQRIKSSKKSTKKRSNKSTDKGGDYQFRDPKFFLEHQISSVDEAAERGYSIKDWSRGGDRIENMVLDVGVEDAEGYLKRRQIKKWDTKKKKYITTTVGGTGFRTRRNESGQIVSKEYKPQLYEKWKQKSRREVSTRDALPEMSVDDLLDPNSSSFSSSSSSSSSFQSKSTNRGPGGKKRKFGSMDKTDFSGPRVDTSKRVRDRRDAFDLKTTAQIKQDRQEKLKNRAKYGRGNNGPERGRRAAKKSAVQYKMSKKHGKRRKKR